ncbi:Plug domain-containing protein [Sphingomonas sp. 1185]|uniref:Plug domain-containing protein n=1 Tax=Sphingomonas sp. 1185 TaxID=3156411 RepID=UPI0033934381
MRVLMGATAIVGSLFALSIEASAQTTPPQQESERPTEEQSGPTQNNEVTVTGTRIRLPNTVSQEPIVTVGSDYLEARNLTNVADALNEIPGFRGSVTPNGTQGSFGQGVNFANAYNLGSNRTLTLVNGRRVVTSNVASVFGNASGGTQVDLNILPTIVIDSVDRVGIGGLRSMVRTQSPER